ncbi:MAG TPA: formimidoylglutamate deiminase [Propionibacteriaceae bacterium]|nr:formimidoylglutamate deiminase [Propionibacteriaceae bacterium]
MSSYWATHAWLPDGCQAGVGFDVEDGRFARVRAGVAPQTGSEILGGVTLPGLANGHSHAFHRVLRGRTHAAGGTFWTWREQMYALAARLDPDSYLLLARAVFAEMAQAGYTVVGEFHYLHHDQHGHPYADPNAMSAALIQAASEAGIRLTLIDACYLAGGLDASGHLPLDPVQARFADRDVDHWRARVSLLSDLDQVRIGSAVHSVRAVPAEALSTIGEAVRKRPLHVHLSEQPAENAATRAFYGCTPTELLDDHGLLGPDTTAVHATHLTDTDIKTLGGSQTSACFCPTTERDLADGIGPARRLIDAGSPLTLGSDQHAVIDPFEELRGLELHERLATGERGRFTPVELIMIGSEAGYHSLGWPDGGNIADGALADFVVVRSNSVRTTGAHPDQIAYAATAADVDQVVVGGRVIVREGRHQLGSPARLLTSALEKLAQT